MPDARVESLRASISRQTDSTFRRAYADLRETCACAIDPRHADRDLARLLLRYAESERGDTPISGRFEAVLTRLDLRVPCASPVSSVVSPKHLECAGVLHEGVASLLGEVFDLDLRRTLILDPWAGDGGLIATMEGQRFSNEADPVLYARAIRRLGNATAVLADSFRLPDRRPTPGFDFTEDENAARIEAEGATEFPVVVSDLRNATRPDARALRRSREAYGTTDVLAACVRWMADRLAPKGIVAFVSDGRWIDDPALAPFRAGLEREFREIRHLEFDDHGLTFLVRGGSQRRILYAASPPSLAEAEWTELVPTDRHVWRTEILRPEWQNFLPLASERSAIFTEASTGLPEGRDHVAKGAKGARLVARRPFDRVWRVPDRKVRVEPTPPGPRIVVLAEPFSVLAVSAPIDAKFAGKAGKALAVGGRIAPAALRRFRSAYGAGVTDGDVFDAVLALLHHPQYRERYHEDLRRSVARVPLPSPGALLALSQAEGAPEVGPNTAYGTGWLDEADFEPGTLPDYDDPFASPYGRADVEPGFLLLSGLGSALYRLQTGYETMCGHEGVARVSEKRGSLAVRPGLYVGGVPPEAHEHRIGRRSALEWLVALLRKREDVDDETAVRLVAQMTSMSLEVLRLSEIVGGIDLDSSIG